MRLLFTAFLLVLSDLTCAKWRYFEPCKCIYKNYPLKDYAVAVNVQMRISKDEIYFTSAISEESYKKRRRKNPDIIGNFYINDKVFYRFAGSSEYLFFRHRKEKNFEITIDNNDKFGNFIVLEEPNYKMLYKGKKHKEIMASLLKGKSVTLSTHYYQYESRKAYPTFSLDGFKEAVDKYIRPPVIEVKDGAIKKVN